MKITAPADLYVPALADTDCGGVVNKGDEIDVPARLAKRLVDQGWKAKKSKEPAPVQETPAKPVSPADTPEK